MAYLRENVHRDCVTSGDGLSSRVTCWPCGLAVARTLGVVSAPLPYSLAPSPSTRVADLDRHRIHSCALASVWGNGDALFLRCTAWREFSPSTSAKPVLRNAGCRAGTAAAAAVRDREGDKHTVIELDVDESTKVGPSLRYATVTVSKTARESAGSEERWKLSNIGFC